MKEAQRTLAINEDEEEPRARGTASKRNCEREEPRARGTASERKNTERKFFYHASERKRGTQRGSFFTRVRESTDYKKSMEGL